MMGGDSGSPSTSRCAGTPEGARCMAVVAHDELMISADSHVIEDAELWIKRLPAAFSEQAPRYQPQELTGFTTQPGGHDPHERIKEMETDGVSAEVLYPTLALRLF